MLAGKLEGDVAAMQTRVKWIPPKWEWVDPLKDRQAEKLAVDAGFRARSDVIEAEGSDPEEIDQRIAEDQERAERLGLSFEQADSQAAHDVAEDTEDEADTSRRQLTLRSDR